MTDAAPGPNTCVWPAVSPPPTRVIGPATLTGGLFNQIYALNALVMHAAHSGSALVLPAFAAFDGASQQLFSELFGADCFAAAMRPHGLVVVSKAPVGVELTKPPSSKRLFERYSKYVEARARLGPNATAAFPGGPNLAAAQVLDAATFRALHLSTRLEGAVQRILSERGLDTANADGGYGCLHARIESDMRKWWPYVARIKPLGLASILELIGHEERLRREKTLFVAVGSDIRAADEALLARQRTAWGARMVRRATPGDRTGHMSSSSRATLANATTAAAAARPQQQPEGAAAAVAAAAPSLTYIESALVDWRICRQASWLVGWPSSAFSNSLAHYRYLDRGQGFYAYCAGTAASASRPTLQYASAERLPRPTLCRPGKGVGGAGGKAAAASAAVAPTPAAAAAAAVPSTGGVALSTAAAVPPPSHSMATASLSTGPTVERLNAVLSELAAGDEAQLDDLFASFRCEHVYLDVGTNIGVQIRKLYEPHKYPKANATHNVYARFFGPAAFGATRGADSRCRVCAIGVEPNPHHRSRLLDLQTRYRAAGVGVLIFAAAASDADGVTRLAVGNADRKDAFEDLGASAVESWTTIRRAPTKKDPKPRDLLATVPVRKFDLSRIVHAVHRRLSARAPLTGKILMKLDVEGLEFAVIPAMIRSQAMCPINAMRIEWHTRLWHPHKATVAARALNLTIPQETGSKALWGFTETIRSKVRELFRAPSSDCQTELFEADDESYMHDRKKWPNETICAARSY